MAPTPACVLAPTAHTPATTPPEQPERELRIVIWRDDWADYEGSAAQLMAEGLIPEGFEWPAAAASKRWQANGFDYRLRRTRPEGHKGPRRSWLELDHWWIRVTVTGRDYHWHVNQRLKRKAEELAAAYHRHTAAGTAEWNANWRRYWAAVDDKRFQQFKALVPGLVPPRRGRKPKAQGTCQGAAA